MELFCYLIILAPDVGPRGAQSAGAYIVTVAVSQCNCITLSFRVLHAKY